MLQSVTIWFKNKSRKAATGRAWKHLPSLAWWVIPQASTFYKEGANAVPKGEEEGGWGRGRSCSTSCSGHLTMSTAALRYAKHFPCNLTHIPRVGRHFFHQVSPKDYLCHKLLPAKSNSLNSACVVGSNQQGGALLISQVGQEGFKERNMSLFHYGQMRYGDQFFPY